MAIQINSQITTPEGFNLTEAYLNISDIIYSKKDNLLVVKTATYASQAARQEGKNPILPEQFLPHFSGNITPEQMANSDIFSLSYQTVKEALNDIFDVAVSDI